MNDSYNPVKLGDPLNEGERLMSELESDLYIENANAKANENDSITSELFDDERNAFNHNVDVNVNDRSLYNKSLSLAWIPATRKICTVCWGQVWYWSANANKVKPSTSNGSNGNNENTGALILEDQDGVDLSVGLNGVSAVISSLTKIIVAPIGGGGRSKNSDVLDRLRINR